MIKYQAAEKFLTSSNALLEQQQKRVLDISTKLENLNPDLRIIAIGNEIDALKIRSGELIKNLEDIANLGKKKEAKENQIKELLKSYCTDTGFDESRNLFIDQKTQIQILQTSDVHGYIYPTSYTTKLPEDLGLAKLSTLINNLRNKNTILIDL